MSNNGYMYLFIRRDLSPAQQIIQTAHAAYEAGFEGKEKTPYAVLIGVENLQELHNAEEYLTRNGIRH